MRVIVVDHDSTMLETIVRALRTHFVIDAVSLKADCIDLLRQNEFDIVVACERLEDGSGLELLGQVARRWPATLRVFAADRERLQLLQGRLGPFELFQTLAYPINPHKLLSTLLLAREAHEADADTTSIQHIVLGNEEATDIQPPPPPPPEPPAKKAAAPATRAAPAGRPGVRNPRGATRPPIPVAVHPPTIQTPAPARPPERPKGLPAARAVGSAAAVIESLSEAAEVAAAATRARMESQEAGMPASRKAFIAGAGCAVALFVIVLGVMQLGPAHHADRTAAALPPAQPHFSKEVTEQVTAVELDFEQDDLAKAQADVQRLQALAPDHPRLQFFLTLLDRGRARGATAERLASTSASKAQRKATGTAARPAEQTPGTPAVASTTSQRNEGVSEGAAAGSTSAKSVPFAGGSASAPSGRATPAPSASATSTPTFGAPLNPLPQINTDSSETIPPPAPAAPSSPRELTDGARPSAPATTASATAESLQAKPSPSSSFGGRTIEGSTPAAAPDSTPQAAQTPPASAEVTKVSATPGTPPPVTAEAQLTRRVAPEYPEAATRKGIEGYVDVHFTITPQGSVTNVSVVDADPADVFDHAAMDAVRRWHYEPKVVDGQPVESQSQVHLQFKLNARQSH